MKGQETDGRGHRTQQFENLCQSMGALVLCLTSSFLVLGGLGPVKAKWEERPPGQENLFEGPGDCSKMLL